MRLQVLEKQKHDEQEAKGTFRKFIPTYLIHISSDDEFSSEEEEKTKQDNGNVKETVNSDTSFTVKVRKEK